MTAPTRTLEEIQASRAARKDRVAVARAAQAVVDEDALDKAEEEHGEGCVASLEVSKYVEGQPTIAIIKAPSADYYKRFCTMVRKAGSNLEARGAAQDLLANSCWVYPSDEAARKSMLAAFPGLLVSVAIQAAKLGELEAAEQGKG